MKTPTRHGGSHQAARIDDVVMDDIAALAMETEPVEALPVSWAAGEPKLAVSLVCAAPPRLGGGFAGDRGFSKGKHGTESSSSSKYGTETASAAPSLLGSQGWAGWVC